MVYTVYKVTNKVNGKFYIGVHKTSNPDDRYLGSGRLIKAAVRKYGRDFFEKEVLHEFSTKHEAYQKERELMPNSKAQESGNYNLMRGGEGGWSHLSASQKSDISSKGVQRYRELYDSDPAFRDRVSLSRVRDTSGRLNGFFGRTHSEEARSQISSAMREKQSGSKNSQYGTAWVCLEGESPRKVKKTELPAFLEAGWQRGRKIKP